MDGMKVYIMWLVPYLAKTDGKFVGFLFGSFLFYTEHFNLSGINLMNGMRQRLKCIFFKHFAQNFLLNNLFLFPL